MLTLGLETKQLLLVTYLCASPESEIPGVRLHQLFSNFNTSEQAPEDSEESNTPY